jgi:hypothetical protein
LAGPRAPMTSRTIMATLPTFAPARKRDFIPAPKQPHLPIVFAQDFTVAWATLWRNPLAAVTRRPMAIVCLCPGKGHVSPITLQRRRFRPDRCNGGVVLMAFANVTLLGVSMLRGAGVVHGGWV